MFNSILNPGLLFAKSCCVLGLLLFFWSPETQAQLDPSVSRLSLPPSVANLYQSSPNTDNSDDFNGSNLDLGIWQYRASDNKSTFDPTYVKIDTEGGNSFVSIKAKKSRDKGAGITSKKRTHYGFYITKWRVSFRGTNDMKGYHPSIWASACNFSSPLECNDARNNGEKRLELDFMEGFKGGYWTSHCLLWHSSKYRYMFRGKDTNYPTGSNWMTMAVEYTPDYLRLWEHDGNGWSVMMEHIIPLNHDEDIYWILSNFVDDPNSAAGSSQLEVDYFYYYNTVNPSPPRTYDEADHNFATLELNRIISKSTGKALQAYNANNLSNPNGNDSKVTIVDQDNSERQGWVILQDANEPYYYYFFNKGTGKYLRAYDPGSTVHGEGEAATIRSNSNFDTYKWKIIPVLGEPGYFYLESRAANLYLRAFNPNSSGNPDGANAIVTLAVNPLDEAIKWRIETFPSLNPIADSYVKGGQSELDNFGSLSSLEVKQSANNDYKRMSFLKFNLSPIQGTVSSAKLRLKVRSNSSGTFSAFHNLHHVGSTQDSWQENEINWSERPTSVSIMEANKPVPDAGEWIEFDITSQVNSESNDTLSVRISHANADEFLVSYFSRDVANPIDFENSQEKPELIYMLDVSPMRRMTKKGEEKRKNQGIQIFPNPSNGIIWLLGSELDGSILEIYDLSGKLLLTNKLKALDHQEINISILPRGLYLLKLMQNGKILHNQKLVLEK